MTNELQFGKNKKHSPKFELVIVTRNAVGEPTGTRSIVADEASKLHDFWLFHQGKPKKKIKTKIDKKNIKQTKDVFVDKTERKINDGNENEK